MSDPDPRPGLWDATWRALPPAGVLAMDARIARALDAAFPVAGRTVLELGCGSGHLLEALLHRGAARVAGVDFSAEAVRLAGERLARWGPGARILRADLLDRDLPALLGERFDLVLSSGLLEHFFPEERKVEVLRRHVECSGAAVALIVPAAPHPNFLRYRLPAVRRKYGPQEPMRRAEMERVLRAAGLAPGRLERFFPLYGLPWVSKREELDRLAERILPRSWGGLWLAVAARVSEADPPPLPRAGSSRRTPGGSG